MRITSFIAVVAMGVALVGGATTEAVAQNLRNVGPPAEFPPDSFKGKQYVDSRGCIYIRAGVDGYTTWVPRVSRDRKVVCGYKPSLPQGTRTATTTTEDKGVEQITLEPADRVATTSTQAPAATKPAPAPKPKAATATKPKPKPDAVAAKVAEPSPGPKPTVYKNPPKKTKSEPVAQPVRTATATASTQTTPRKPSPGPEPTVFQNPPKPAATAPVAVQTTTARATKRAQVRKPSPGPEPTVFGATEPAAAPVTVAATTATSPCANASDFSQGYINDGKRHPVRCGPQATSPYLAGARVADTSGQGAAIVTTGTRVVPRHVYDNRRNTQNVIVPKGYRTVWEDGRLNPKRAERTLAPYKPGLRTTVPTGYRVAWEDGRLNPKRGGTANGDQQTGQIWTETLPRTLKKVPTDRQIVRDPNAGKPGLPRARTPARAASKPAATQSTRQRQQATKGRYIRVAAYATDADARKAAQGLARRTGLTVRLGTLHRKGKTYRVVMAGPFTTDASASSAMAKVRNAGFGKAKLSK